MQRTFKRRLAALDPHREGEELIAALAVIRTGESPPTHADERAAELWESISRDEKDDMMRLLSFQLRETGMSLSLSARGLRAVDGTGSAGSCTQSGVATHMKYECSYSAIRSPLLPRYNCESGRTAHSGLSLCGQDGEELVPLDADQHSLPLSDADAKWLLIETRSDQTKTAS